MGAACVRGVTSPPLTARVGVQKPPPERAVIFCVLRTQGGESYSARLEALHAALHLGTLGPAPCVYEGGSGNHHLVCVRAEEDLVGVAAAHGFQCGWLHPMDVPAASFTPAHRAVPNNILKAGAPAFLLVRR